MSRSEQKPCAPRGTPVVGLAKVDPWQIKICGLCHEVMPWNEYCDREDCVLGTEVYRLGAIKNADGRRGR